MTENINDLRSRAGRILYRELPEEYRYRDTGTEGDFGDLEAMLHGFGHLLDQIRMTTEQAHADSFAEPLDDGRAIQPWVVPYLAELLGAELTAPDPVARADELNNSVAWFKSKGTLSSIDNIGDVVARTETVAKEGWRMTAQTPRMDLPPFTQHPDAAQPSNVVTPDFRKLDRAVVDEGGSNPLHRLKADRHDPDARDSYWRPLAPNGVSCFPRAYDDSTARSPDLRDPDRVRRIGPHPRRTLIHVRPPQGIFHKALPEVVLGQKKLNALLREGSVVRAEDLLPMAQLGDGITGPAVIAKTPAKLNLPNRAVTFEGIRFVSDKGDVTLKGAANTNVTFIDCAAHTVQLALPKVRGVSFRAVNSVFELILADGRHGQMEYCTVMEGADFARLDASDCLFVSLADTLICADAETPPSCIRYSRFAQRDEGRKKSRRCLDARGGSNTTALPQFIDRWHMDDKDCVKRIARYGEAGYAVLDTDTTAAITTGAEDEGEMGAGHGLYHAASLRALKNKLEQFLPLGQEIAIFYDPMLALSPPISGSADSDI
ncbi:hypothetical protein SAMN05444273_10189 [Litoreibacter ascidiaceicola]|uniref:Phage tail protein (Tail_P2_I) n=1 Tax=Litoreibacter ascidiaceicola TaxID=1486859 RepID=A0A1M4SIJ5_9RHOB|nr:hypothetical protein [Litoreibacter ascidiaceicola]SHE32053.1 hypothetical protein SAMN05444273_10189 [Litoreibacter ascidiaceicola]